MPQSLILRISEGRIYDLEGIGVLKWNAVRDMPRALANQQNEFVVQMVDKFQFLDSEICWDEAKTNQASDLAAGRDLQSRPQHFHPVWLGGNLRSCVPSSIARRKN